MTDLINIPEYSTVDLLTPSVLNSVKHYLQTIDVDAVDKMNATERKNYIRDATRILVIEHDNHGYTDEELAFYVKLRYKELSKDKSNGYIMTQVKETIKSTSYIETSYMRLFGKEQRRYLVRT